MTDREMPGDDQLAGVTLLPVKKVAALLSLHERTVWKMAVTGEIPAPIKIGSKASRWRLSELQEFIANGKQN